jgi:hypothetical protein
LPHIYVRLWKESKEQQGQQWHIYGLTRYKGGT